MASSLGKEQGHNCGFQLSLAYSSQAAAISCERTLHPGTRSRGHRRLAALITKAINCRLGIPDGSTIVGLLGVGPSKDNYDELLKWVTRELPSLPEPEAPETVDQFIQRLLRITDGYPEC